MARSMNLDEFCSYVANQWRAMLQVYAEIEQVQQQLNDIHLRNLQLWQEAVPPLAAEPSALPPQMARDLLAMVEEERAKLEQECRDLGSQIGGLRQRADGALAAAQSELQALRQMNPQLDAEEERTKLLLAELGDSIRALDAQIRGTGWLQLGLRRRLREQRDESARALQEARTRLRSLRQTWDDQKQRYQGNQARLQQEWEQASIEAAQKQARLDHLQANIKQLARQQGAARYLASLQQAPDVGGRLQPVLNDMVARNRLKAAYEEGLRAVAESLGLLRGLAEGMDRFYRSAEKVLEEQRRYNLARLKVRVDDLVLSFHAVWPEFASQVKDEKALGVDPLEFSRRVHSVIQSRLGDQAIAAMFESMGASLSEATKAWDG